MNLEASRAILWMDTGIFISFRIWISSVYMDHILGPESARFFGENGGPGGFSQLMIDRGYRVGGTGLDVGVIGGCQVDLRKQPTGATEGSCKISIVGPR